MKFEENSLYYVVGIDKNWKVVAKYLERKENILHFDDVLIVYDTVNSDLQKNWTLLDSELDNYASFKYVGKTLDDIPEFYL